MKQLIFLSLLAFLSNTLFAQKQPVPQYLFILDASGSMWQKMGSDYKISVAKSVLNDLVKKLPADARVGLIAYGHNRKSDCEDIETLVPLSVLNPANFSSKLNAINPQGKTPIAKSIQHALNLLREETQAVSIILVSDGLETCDGNACELVKQAKAKGVKITMHVVGFGLEEKDISALECLAQAGDGQYFPADNASELGQALEKTVEKPVLDGGCFSLKATEGGKLLDVLVKIFKDRDTKETALGRTYAQSETNPRVMLLPPGEYRAEIEALSLDGRPVQKIQNLVITAHDTLFKEVEFSKGNLEILVTRNGALSDATVTVYKSGTREVAAQTRTYRESAHNPAKFSLLPGAYDVEISSVEISGKPADRFENQQVSLYASTTLYKNFLSGELKVGARQGRDFVDATVGIYPKTGGTSVGSGRTYMSDSSNPKTFVLEPGEYEIRLSAVKPAGLGKKTLHATVTENGTSTVTGNW